VDERGGFIEDAERFGLIGCYCLLGAREHERQAGERLQNSVVQVAPHPTALLARRELARAASKEPHVERAGDLSSEYLGVQNQIRRNSFETENQQMSREGAALCANADDRTRCRGERGEQFTRKRCSAPLHQSGGRDARGDRRAISQVIADE